jgi:peroxiredoxin Q/BCP
MNYVVLISALLLSATPALAAPGVGDSAPAFSLPGSDGQTYTLSQYVGKKPVVIAWFPKAFTAGWTLECASLRDSGDELKGHDIAYFAASVDDVQTNHKFAEELQVNYPILSDLDKSVAKEYGVLAPGGGYAQRWTFYIDKTGKIARIDKQVSPQTSGADLLKNLKELGW